MAELIVHFIDDKHWSGVCDASDGIGSKVFSDVTCDACRSLVAQTAELMLADERADRTRKRRALHVLSPYAEGTEIPTGYQTVDSDCGHKVLASAITVELLANSSIEHVITCPDHLGDGL